MWPDCTRLGYCPVKLLDEPSEWPSKNIGVDNGKQMVVRR